MHFLSRMCEDKICTYSSVPVVHKYKTYYYEHVREFYRGPHEIEILILTHPGQDIRTKATGNFPRSCRPIYM